MIGISKILTGKATVSAAMRQSGGADAHLLQFSTKARPVVVWNSTAACNLSCLHCYAEEFAGVDRPELSTDEARAFIDDLASINVPVLIFSGGEPLMRPDIFELASLAVEKGLRVALSTNGTLIDAEVARKLKAAGFSYVGVSLDGLAATHDHFRRCPGAFDASLAGLRTSAAAGLRTGVRFTLTRDNFNDLPQVLDLVESERINRFCMYHLVYVGRGASIIDHDVTREQSRRAVGMLISKSLDWASRDIDVEILTADNHADGILLLKHIESTRPDRVDEVRTLLEMAGGCSAGRKIAAVDPFGNVHPCQFWRHESAGSIRSRRFSELWRDSNNACLAALRAPSPSAGLGRCALCRYAELCGGCRIRALAASGALAGEDPQCYLSDAEIGL